MLPKKLFDQSLENLSVSSYSQCNFSWRQLQSVAQTGVGMPDRSVIFTDNAAVAAGMAQLLAGVDVPFWQSHPDRDLWNLSHRIYSAKPSPNIIMRWTQARRTLQSAASFTEMWMIWHNGCADQQAGRTLQQEVPSQLQHQRNILRTTLEEVIAMKTRIFCFVRSVLDRFDA